MNPYQSFFDHGTIIDKNLIELLGARVSTDIYKFKTKNNLLSSNVRAACIELSQRYTAASEKHHGRGWNDILHSLLVDEDLKIAQVPYELRGDTDQPPQRFADAAPTAITKMDDWMYNLRCTVLKCLYIDKKTHRIAKLLGSKKEVNDAQQANDFAKGLLGVQGSASYQTKFASYRLKIDSPPGPQPIFAMLALISECGTATPEALTHISDMITAGGRPGSNFTCIDEITEKQGEIGSSGYMCQVCFNLITRYQTHKEIILFESHHKKLLLFTGILSI